MKSSTHNSCTNSKRGFTLWELLVVLLVIALLFGLLMPSLSRVRMYSVRIVCNSHMHQMSLAGEAYLNDSDGYFPSEPNDWLFSKESISSEHPLGCRWHDRAMASGGAAMAQTEAYQGLMWPYIGHSLRPCPTFRRFGDSKGCENPNHNDAIDIEPVNSYTINGYLGTTRPGGVLRRNQVRDPAEVFYFSEENPWSIQPSRGVFTEKWPPEALSTRALDDSVLLISPTKKARDCFATYHDAPSGNLNRGEANVAYVDGHVGRIAAKDQLRGTKGRGASRLGPSGNLAAAWASKSPPPGGWGDSDAK